MENIMEKTSLCSTLPLAWIGTLFFLAQCHRFPLQKKAEDLFSRNPFNTQEESLKIPSKSLPSSPIKNPLKSYRVIRYHSTFKIHQNNSWEREGKGEGGALHQDRIGRC